MVKKLKTASTIVLVMAAFAQASAQRSKQNSTFAAKTDVKFLSDIEVSMEPIGSTAEEIKKTEKNLNLDQFLVSHNKNTTTADNTANSIEGASSLQIKYGLLLNIELELIKNFNLYRAIDEWYGTPYRWGGSSKSGVDCSAFVQSIYSNIFNILLPRTAREQYSATRQLSRDELKEGDLVFFNTIGGVSHVGIYLQNNKFVHAATSEGVMISDLDDNYWSKRFINGSRYEANNVPAMML